MRNLYNDYNITAWRGLLVSVLLTACGAGGCSQSDDATSASEGDPPSSEEDLTSGSAGACALSRDALLDQVSGERRVVLERGFGWLDARVPYSQGKMRDGFRTDCSGFVSMCWDLKRSYTTLDFIRGDGEASALASYDDLIPGDALVRRSQDSGHIVLFLGWNDRKHDAACVLEQMDSKHDMQFRTRTAASLEKLKYKAIRASKLAAETNDDNEDRQSKRESEGADEKDTAGSGEDDGNPAGGCWSATLRQRLPPLACVQSRFDRVWFQCKDGAWYRGVQGDDGPYGPCSEARALGD